MDFYERKEKAVELIVKLVESGVLTRKDIIFAVLEKTGLGKNFASNYIDEKIKRGFFVENSNGIITKNTHGNKISPEYS
jgi:hypothetical protein